MKKPTATKYNSKGAVPYTRCIRPSELKALSRSRVDGKSLVEHDKPVFLNELDEFDELMEQHPNLFIPYTQLVRCAQSEYRVLDEDIMYIRKKDPVGWKDSTRCAAQYGKQCYSRMPRRRTKDRKTKPQKKRVYADGMYFVPSARIQFHTPRLLRPDAMPEAEGYSDFERKTA